MKFGDKHKFRGEKQAIKTNKIGSGGGSNRFQSKSVECKPQQLVAIGNRLLDWFSVIMADTKKRKQHTQKSKGKVSIIVLRIGWTD